MTTPMRNHALLGFPRLEPDTCSKCCHTIPDDHVPLILWAGEDKSLMWCYCAACEGGILEAVKAVKTNTGALR